MASLIARDAGRFELRETVATPAGPRSRTLATFAPPLAPEVLDRAERRATRPFDRAAILARAAALGIPVRDWREDRQARALLADLRRGLRLDPALAAELRAALAAEPEAAPRFAEVAEWMGAPVERRGATVRDLVRVADRIAQGRGERKTRPKPRYPRFSSRRARSKRAARAR